MSMSALSLQRVAEILETQRGWDDIHLDGDTLNARWAG